MNQHFKDSHLTAMAVPVVPARQHQLQLKRALLSSTPHKPKGWRIIMSKKPLLMGALTLGVAVVALTAGAFIAPQDSAASAQGLVKDSTKAVAQLSPAAKHALAGTINADVDDQLKAAKAAKDLEVLTYDQVSGKYGHILPPKNDQGPDLTTLKYLKYTDDQGATVMLGLDTHNLPVFCTVMMGDPNGAPGSGPASVHMEGRGSVGNGSGDGPSFSTGGATTGGSPSAGGSTHSTGDGPTTNQN